MASKRESGSEQRRARIFTAARALISSHGVDALTTRALAKEAGLTVPTLYNLVGDKTAILTHMVSQSVEAIWARLEFNMRANPLEMADAIIDEAYAVVRQDWEFHRAILPLMIELEIVFAANPQRDDIGARAANRCVDMAVFACRAAAQDGLLRGHICAEELGQQMFITYRGPMRDWLEGAIATEEMLRRQRRGFYLTMAADASDEFRALLTERVVALSDTPIREEAA